MRKYMTQKYLKEKIKSVEVERETESSVWVDGRRNAKSGQYANYFDTWLEAKSFLLCEAAADVVNAKSKLDHYKSKLQEIEALQETPNAD